MMMRDAAPASVLKKYLNDLLSGKKTPTIRLGNVKYRPGDVTLVHCGGLVLGRMRITPSSVRGSLILHRRARVDGFDNLRELPVALRQRYPNQGQHTPNDFKIRVG